MNLQELEQLVHDLQHRLSNLEKSDRYSFAKHIQMLDGTNFIAGTSKGLRIGTATTQKLGAYGVTPIAQRSGSAQTAVATTASTNLNPWGYSTQAQADAIVSLTNELRAWAVAIGFMKGSA